MSSEHGHCPNCNADLNGGLIWEHFFKQFTEGSGYWLSEDGTYTEQHRTLSRAEAEEVADKVAKPYRATRTKGRWGREIGIYDMFKDRTVAFKCPDCNHEWDR